MRVNVNVLDSWCLDQVDLSLLIAHLLVEHFQFLLILLDADLYAVYKHFIVDHLLFSKSLSCLFVSDSSHW